MREGGMMRRFIALLMSGIVTTMVAGTASAAPPIIERTGWDAFHISIPAGAVCDFGLEIDVRQRLTITTFVDADGDPIRGLTTGFVEVVFMNAETNEIVRQAIPGPGFYDADGTIVRGAGPWSGNVNLSGELVTTWGNVTFGPDFTVLDVKGREEPVCGLLDA